MPEVPALRRSVAILRHLAASNRPLSAGSLVRSLSVPRSSVYELLSVLEELGLVTKTAGGYLLGAGVSELGSAYMRVNPLQRLAQPSVRALADATGGTAQLAVLRGWETVYVLKEQAVNSIAVITATGVRMPSYLTATGRAIMAAMSKREVLALLAGEDTFVNRTGVGPRSLAELNTLLARTRTQGYALEAGEITPNVWTVAAPVFDVLDRPVAAVGVCLPAEAGVSGAGGAGTGRGGEAEAGVPREGAAPREDGTPREDLAPREDGGDARLSEVVARVRAAAEEITGRLR